MLPEDLRKAYEECNGLPDLPTAYFSEFVPLSELTIDYGPLFPEEQGAIKRINFLDFMISSHIFCLAYSNNDLLEIYRKEGDTAIFVSPSFTMFMTFMQSKEHFVEML